MLCKYSFYSKFNCASLKILSNNKFEFSAKMLFGFPTLVLATKNKIIFPSSVIIML